MNSPHVGRRMRQRQQPRRASDAFARALGLRQNERQPVALLWTHSFFLGLACAYFVSAAFPLFLNAYSIDDLLPAFAIAAVLQLLIGHSMDRLGHSIGEYRLLFSVLLFVIVSTIVFRIMLHTHAAGAIFGLVVWAQAVLFITDNAFWNLSTQFFDVRQGKRLFSLIDSGAFLAKILGYFSVPLLLPIINVPDLLLFSVVALGIAVYLLYIISRRLPRRVSKSGALGVGSALSHSSPTEHSHHSLVGWRHFLGHKYLISLGAIAFLSLVAITSINYGFLREIDRKFSQTTEIAYFLGLFFGGAKLVSLLLKVGFVGRLFERFGMARVSMVLPVALLIVTVMGLITTANAPSGASMIWAFSANMLLVEMWTETVHMPMLTIALQPLRLHERELGHRAIDSTIEPIALGVAAALLYVLTASIGLTLTDISFVMLGIFVLWIVAGLVFDREYLSAVASALKHRRLVPADLTWDHTARQMVAEKIASDHPSEAEYALHLIPQSESELFASVLPTALASTNESVQQSAIRRIEGFQFSEEDESKVADALNRLVSTGGASPTILGDALQSYSQLPQHQSDVLARWLDDDRPPVREGLYAGFLRSHGSDGAHMLGTRFDAMVKSADVSERASAAAIIGRAKLHNFYRPLLDLLADPSIDVRTAAARAAGEVRNAALIEPLLDQYLGPSPPHELLAAVEDALREMGPAVLPHIAKRVEEGLFDSSRILRVTRLLAYWSASTDETLQSASARLLSAFLFWPPKHHRVLSTLRRAALHALVEANASLPEPSLAERVMRDEHRRSELVARIAIRVETSGDTALQLLRSALLHELRASVDRMLLALALVQDRHTVARIRDSLAIGGELQVANAIETLSHLLSTDISKPAIALIEASVLAAKHADAEALRHLKWHLQPATDADILTFIEDRDRFFEPWSVALGTHVFAPLPAVRAAVGINATRSDIAGTIATLLLEQPTAAMPIIFERVFLLKTVALFRETPDPVLAHVAQALEEVHVAEGARIMEKGELGNCLYIIVEGRVAVRDGEHTLSTLGPREVVGELALLDPEPRSATVVALEATSLLKLDWEAFFDLMVDNIELARGAIAMLCRRLRNQNRELTRLQSEMESR